jgi:2-aminobenzoate-CoA ligase
VRDNYPAGSSIPEAYLVPPELQPEFNELDGCEIAEFDNAGMRIADGNVAAGRGDMEAIVHAESGRSYTFCELAEASDRLASGLRSLGLGLGDRVAFRSANVPELVIVALACWKAGAAIVPTPALLRADELRFFLDDTGARFLFVGNRSDLYEEVPAAIAGTSVERVIGFGDEEQLSGVLDWSELMPGRPDRVPPVPSDTVAIVWHTGGTTGIPKAIYHTHRRMLLGAYALARATGVSPGERWAAAMPVGHALGFASQTLWSPLPGATVIMVEGFHSPRALAEAIHRHRVDTFAAITVTWARILEVLEQDDGLDVSSLQRGFAMWQSASSSEVYDAWKDRGVELMNNFGCTAFSSWILCPDPTGPIPRASLGRPVPGYEVRAVELDEQGMRDVGTGEFGRLVARGVSGLTYWNRPELQQRDVRDGWVVVDDLIEFDEDGNAAYLGRTDYLISTAGHKVAPVEVEEVLSKHPAVREVGVVGAPDPIRQEVVMAFVALREGVDATSELRRELQDYVKANLSPFKYPRRVEFVPSLPRDHVGKLQPAVLREWAKDPAGVTA